MTLFEIEAALRLEAAQKSGEWTNRNLMRHADALKAERERIKARLLSFDLHLDKPCECTHNRNGLHVCCDCGGPMP